MRSNGYRNMQHKNHTYTDKDENTIRKGLKIELLLFFVQMKVKVIKVFSMRTQ